MKESVNKEFFKAIKQLSEQKGIPADYLYEKIKAAIASGIKNPNAECEFNEEKQIMRAFIRKNVVAEVEDDASEIVLEEARAYDKRAIIGGVVEIPIQTKQVGRIVAQTAKSVIRQGIREWERSNADREMESLSYDAVTVRVISINSETGDAKVEIGKAEAYLKKSEMLPNDDLKPDDYVKVYVAMVEKDNGAQYASMTRRHSGLVKRLFETEVPEIYDGTVEIVSVSREAGSRTKISVRSNDENVDPIGACIGPKGARVTNVIDALCGEKIDIVRYSDDAAQYIASALAPAEVINVITDPSGARVCTVVVADNQLSLAIGNKGQNVRLAAKLTGWKIDIKPQSQMLE